MFNSDRPIKTTEEDLLGRTFFAEKLASSIKEIQQGESVVIGLQGPWGSGKTSTINIAKRKLEESSDHKTKIVSFNPWNSLGEKSLPLEFFRTLLARLCRLVGKTQYKGEILKSLAIALDDYSCALSGGGKALAKMTSRALNGKADKNLDSIEERKNRVSEILEDIGIKMLVIIDDIDRLSCDQVCSIFQLVATIADFPNINYLLSYDKKTISRALSHVQEDNGEKYLEKIIQVTIDIPETQQITIVKILRKELSITTNYLPIDLEDDYYNYQLDNLVQGVAQYVNNIRNAKKYINTLRFELNYFEGKINPFDISAMTAFKVFAPRILGTIKTNDDFLCKISPKKDEQTKQDFLSLLPSEEREKALFLLASVFPVVGVKNDEIIACPPPSELIKRNSLAYRPNFTKYFFGENQQNPSEFDIDEIVFECSLTKIEPFIEKIAAQGSLADFSAELQSRKREMDEARTILIAESLLKNIWRAQNTDDSFSEKRFISLVASGLLEVASIDQSSIAVEESVEELSANRMTALAYFIIEQERSYGRYGLSGANHQPVVDEDTLNKLEDNFCTAMNSLAGTNSMLKRRDSKIELHLWKKIDSPSYRKYLELVFADAVQAAFASQLFLTIWHSKDGCSWTANKDFEEYVSCENYQDRISTAICTTSFWEADHFVVECAAALSLCIRDDRFGTTLPAISNNEVQNLIAKWHSEFTKRINQK